MHFQKAIAIDPEYCAALNELGTVYLRVSRVDLAIQQFKEAVAAGPHRAGPYSNLAIAYPRQSLYDDAERSARRAIDLDRGNAHSHLVLGIALVLQKKFTVEAEKSLRRAAPDFPLAEFWLGVGQIARGDIPSAKDQLKAYLARGPRAGADLAKSLMEQMAAVANE